MKIVYLDSSVMSKGTTMEPLKALGVFEKFDVKNVKQGIAAFNGELEPLERFVPCGCDENEPAVVAIADGIPMTEELMDACPNLKMIAVAATGYNHIDIQAARKRGIAVANVPAYAGDSVAQHAMSLLLLIACNLPQYLEMVNSGDWGRLDTYTELRGESMLLAGKSIGIIGYGNIGKQIGRMAEGFGMKVNVYSRDREAAIRSDVVSISCPMDENNVRFVNAEFINEMKDGAILINTARGGLVDEEALAAALKSGKLWAAGLDVLTQEPPRDGSPLIGLPNCFITPHIAIAPDEVRQRVIDVCAENIKDWAAGGKLNRVD